MRRAVVAGVAVVAGYAVLALLLYRPINPLDATRLPRGGIGDPVQMSWFLEWTAQALVHGRNPFQTTALDYPLGVNLAVNTLTPALGVLAAPVTLTLGPVAAFNLLLRLSFVASASSMCFVLRRWCPWWPAAVLGGLLYGFGPYALSQGQANAHLVLLFNPLLPLLFALLDELLVRRRREPRLVGVLIGLVAALQFLIDVELLAEAAILAIVAIALISARAVVAPTRRAAAPPPTPSPGPADPPGRPAGVIAGAGRLARAALPAVAAFAAVAGLGLYELLLGRRHLNGPVQSLSLLDTLRYDLLSAVVPTSLQAVRTDSMARLADGFVGHNLSENGGYLGPVLVVMFVAVAWSARRSAIVRTASLLAVVAWVLSLGPRLSVDGHRLGVPLPGAVFRHLPLLGSVIAARFALFTDLFVAVVLAVGLQRLHTRPAGGDRPDRPAGHPAHLRARRRGGQPARARSGPAGRRAAIASAVAIIVGLAGIAPAARVTERPLGWPRALAAELRGVVPRDGVVLAYPYPTSPYDAAMGWAAEDRIAFRLVGGYATVPGPPGSHRAQTAPDLVAPVSIQELLASAAAGPLSPYPPPDRTLGAATLRRDLLRMLHDDRVDVVVDWPIGTDPAAATHLFAMTLGPPTWRVGDVLIWRLARA